MLAGAGAAAGQKVYTVDDVPNVRLANAGSAVSNPDGTLSAVTVAEVDRKLVALQRQTSIEVAVVVIGSIGEETPEDFGISLFRKWGLGKAEKNNGLLILLVTGDRFVRFEGGYGLEGVITDAMSKRIQTTRMMPYLLAGDWDGAVVSAVDAVTELLTDPDSDLGNEPERQPAEDFSPFGVLFIFGGLAVILLIAMLAQRRANKCPRCGAQMKVVDTQTVRISPTRRQITTTLRCPKCGYTTTRSRIEDIGSALAGGMIGGMLGGMGRGRGGGFGGGSWGGGSAGGGGATTRF